MACFMMTKSQRRGEGGGIKRGIEVKGREIGEQG